MLPLLNLSSANYTSPVTTYITQRNTSNNYLNTTWPAVPIGTAASGRYIVASLHCDAGTVTPTEVIIGGINTTVLQSAPGIGIFIAPVPTGTTADIYVAFSGTSARHALGIWTVTNLSRPIPTGVVSTGSGLNASCTISVPNGSTVISALAMGGTTVVWTGATGDFDVQNGNATKMSGARTFSLTRSNINISATAGSSVSWSLAAIALL